jgi:hypothetical protein
MVLPNAFLNVLIRIQAGFTVQLQGALDGVVQTHQGLNARKSLKMKYTVAMEH